jgi:hypothetical protein
MGARMFTINNTMRILSSALILFSFNTLPFVTSSIAIADNIPNPYSIGGVRIRMTESQVNSIWGKPLSRSKVELACFSGFSFAYPQGEISFESRRNNRFTVFSIVTKNRKWKTEKGVKIGDDISKAKKLYSITSNGYSKKSDTEWHVENSTNRPGNLKFKTNRNQKITAIYLIENYDNC